MMGPIAAFFTALVGGAVLSRPKLPELEPKPDKLAALSADFERLRANRNELLQENARMRWAHDALLRMLAEEQRARLQLERALAEADARVSVLRSNAKRSQAPRHLPLPPAPLIEGAQQLNPQVMADLRRGLDAFICNCAPGRADVMLGARYED